MPHKKWKFKELINQEYIQPLADALSVSNSIAQLLALRNIRNFDEAKTFFRPSLEHLHDPFLMDGMNTAVNRILNAIQLGEKICVYGDYDVDGTCSTSILYMFLKELHANVIFYIPKRLEDGYGISRQGILFAVEEGVKLIISVDCGITAIEEAKLAKELNVDLIISDHHQPKDVIPDAFAVLDPLKPGCNYPFKYLSGAGVAYKIAQAISSKFGDKERPNKYLDLVALAAAADIVPLVDENRILAFEGLKKINVNPRPGIAALIEKSHIKIGNITSGQLIFSIAPRINAVGRLGDAAFAVELLIEEKIDKARSMAEHIESENTDRKKIDNITFNEAADLITNSMNLSSQIPIILHQDKWHAGVIGIVASRLVEKYYRPTIILTTIDGVAQGSARSISNFDIYGALKDCEDLLIHFGGHKAAAGLAVSFDKLEEFKTRFAAVVGNLLTEQDLLPELFIDSQINLSHITGKFFRILEQFAPFGPGNQKPVFLAMNVEVCGTVKIFKDAHISFTVKHENRNYECIGFNLIQHKEIVKCNNKVDIVFTIDKNIKNDKEYPQLNIKDIKLNENNQELFICQDTRNGLQPNEKKLP